MTLKTTPLTHQVTGKKLRRRKRFQDVVWSRANTLYWSLRKQGFDPDTAEAAHDAHIASWGVAMPAEVAARIAAREEAHRAALVARNPALRSAEAGRAAHIAAGSLEPRRGAP